jgi:hypothetical protein
MSVDVAQLTRLLDTLSDAEKSGRPLSELLAAVIVRKNRDHALGFLRTPYAERLILVPQCLRSTTACRAEERKHEYVCAQCGGCKIGEISRRAGDLGYTDVKILKGGSALTRLLEEIRPKAVLGIACSGEGLIGILACERAGVPVICVPLLKDGCADTDVDLSDVAGVLEVIVP